MDWLQFFGQTESFSFSIPVAQKLGTLAAVLFGQLCAASACFPTGTDFPATREYLCNKTGMSEKQFTSTLKLLSSEGIVSVTRKGVPARNYYKLNVTRFMELFGIENAPNSEENEENQNFVPVAPIWSDKPRQNSAPSRAEQEKSPLIKEILPPTPPIKENITPKKELPPYNPPKGTVPGKAEDDMGESKGDDFGSKIATIVAYLNTASGKNFRPSIPATRQHIAARLKEGRTVEDFKTVIDTKVAEWRHTDMEKYLRPDTLFRPANFENYLNQECRLPDRHDLPSTAFAMSKMLDAELRKRNPDRKALDETTLRRWAAIFAEMYNELGSWDSVGDPLVYALKDDFWRGIIGCPEDYRKNYRKIATKAFAKPNRNEDY